MPSQTLSGQPPVPVDAAGPGVRWWSELAIRAGLYTAALSRRAGRGAGSIIGGRVTMALDPGALRGLASGRRVVLVSGTNGKTTTSHMVAAALGTLGAVAHNASGSNMTDGAVAALAEDRAARRAVLEVDELHLAEVASRCAPATIVLLNLTRDQLDRTKEVRETASAIGATLAGLSDTTVIANADDPMTVWAARRASGKVIWVSVNGASDEPSSQWDADSVSCPGCGQLLAERGLSWWCGCGLARPEPDWWLDGELARTGDTKTRLVLRLPGSVNRGNAVLAMAAAALEGVDPESASAAIGAMSVVQGRYATVDHHGYAARLLLAKNPAGWAATLSMLTSPKPLLISVNAREADGRDTSWLWDVDFAALRGRKVVATGDRAADLGVRLSYADVEHHTEPDPVLALHTLPAGAVDVVANYTAFGELRRLLGHAG